MNSARIAALVATAVVVLNAASVGAASASARSVATATTVAVSSASQLTKALTSAVAGETITVAKGLYVGTFTASGSGTAAAPITLSGAAGAVLSTGKLTSGYGLHVTGDYWNVTGISVTNSGKGIVLDGSTHTTINNVDVGDIGDEGVHFRASSSYGVLENSTIHDTGRGDASYGEGVYIGSAQSNWKSIMGSSTTRDKSDYVSVLDNHISNTTAEGVDVKEGTLKGSLTGNVFTNAGYSGENSGDSWVDVKGNDYTITGNSGSKTLLDAFQVHDVLKGWGLDNTFTDNTVKSGVPGYEVWVQSASLDTVVTCKTSGADKGLTNGRCTK